MIYKENSYNKNKYNNKENSYVDYNAKLFCDFEENFDEEYDAISISKDKNNENKKKTKIIVFEGIDGSGKTTQIKILKKFLDYKGFTYFQTREPGGSPEAEKIRELFLSEKNFSIEAQILLCTAARKEHLNYLEKIQKETHFDFIIFDRFIDSTIAYQIFPNKLNPEIVYSLNRKFKINLEVDLAILLDIDPNYSIQRRKKIENHFDLNLEYLKQVRKAYLKIWKKDVHGKENFKKRIIVESGKNPKIIFKKILQEMKTNELI